MKGRNSLKIGGNFLKTNRLYRWQGLTKYPLWAMHKKETQIKAPHREPWHSGTEKTARAVREKGKVACEGQGRLWLPDSAGGHSGNAWEAPKEKHFQAPFLDPAKLSIKAEARRKVFLDAPSLVTFTVDPRYPQITYLWIHLLAKICLWPR